MSILRMCMYSEWGVKWCLSEKKYRQISNISHNKSPNLNVYCFALQLSLPNPLKPVVKSALLQLHLSDQQFYYLPKVRLMLEILRYDKYPPPNYICGGLNVITVIDTDINANKLGYCWLQSYWLAELTVISWAFLRLEYEMPWNAWDMSIYTLRGKQIWVPKESIVLKLNLFEGDSLT